MSASENRVGVFGDSWTWRAGTTAEVADLARRWLASSAFEHLMAALGGPAPATVSPTSLATWTAAHLDTRRGAERRDASTANWPPDWIQGLLAAAAPLGLIRTGAPARDSYDSALILGGATTGNRLRVALVDRLLDSGYRFGEIVALTAERVLGARELASEPDAADDRSEWRNLMRYLEASFGPLRSVVAQTGAEHKSGDTISWRDETYASQKSAQLRLLLAPGSTGRRATTADAIRFYLSRGGGRTAGSRLVVTSAIYAPYQFFAIAPALLHAGVNEVELVGTPTAQDGSSELAQRVGQEIHAAVEAASRLAPGGAVLPNPEQ